MSFSRVNHFRCRLWKLLIQQNACADFKAFSIFVIQI